MRKEKKAEAASPFAALGRGLDDRRRRFPREERHRDDGRAAGDGGPGGGARGPGAHGRRMHLDRGGEEEKEKKANKRGDRRRCVGEREEGGEARDEECRRGEFFFFSQARPLHFFLLARSLPPLDPPSLSFFPFQKKLQHARDLCPPRRLARRPCPRDRRHPRVAPRRSPGRAFDAVRRRKKKKRGRIFSAFVPAFSIAMEKKKHALPFTFPSLHSPSLHLGKPRAPARHQLTLRTRVCARKLTRLRASTVEMKHLF